MAWRPALIARKRLCAPVVCDLRLKVPLGRLDDRRSTRRQGPGRQGVWSKN
jgi:hypothetical protein